MKTQIEKDGNKKVVETVSLAFRVKPHGDNLFSAEMLMLARRYGCGFASWSRHHARTCHRRGG